MAPVSFLYVQRQQPVAEVQQKLRLWPADRRLELGEEASARMVQTWTAKGTQNEGR